MLFWIKHLFLIATLTQAWEGVDVEDAVITFTCMKKAGKSLAVIRGYCGFGGIDYNALRNLQNAKSSGMLTDLYFSPCRGKSATSQVSEFLSFFDAGQINSKFESQQDSKPQWNQNQQNDDKKIIERDEITSFEGNNYIPLQDSGLLYGTIWVIVEINPSKGCSWNLNSAQDNCAFLSEVVSLLQSKGKKVGIFSSYYMWEAVMGHHDSCQNFTSIPVWYAHYNNQANFNDWGQVQFGGWSKPSMKQYIGDTSFCQADVNLNYF